MAERRTREWSSLLVEIAIAMASSGCVKANRTCTIHCHPRGTGNGICCNEPNRVGEGEYEEANATDQVEDRHVCKLNPLKVRERGRLIA